MLGGGNSAGQAAARLAGAGERVKIVIRGATLAATMSDYLRREIAAAQYQRPVRLRRDRRRRHRTPGQPRDLRPLRRLDPAVDAAALFIFIGAMPHTAWLEGALAIDDYDFVLTGPDLTGSQPSAWLLDRSPAWLETSIPGVFAAGDIRHGSTKRVAGAVGAGSTTAMLVGSYLTS